ncbi:DEAD/DEAH box helicase [Specibacter cremeus]|uniref:DEAD/DEAH box helicase n=1 Tax=Specibacter cremeus TaxID=1629051 RepID=UPI000F7B6B54|nr:DEAD/DEAH box helicase [Specibacter cremeus]
MIVPVLPSVTAYAIAALVGPAAYARGKEYAGAGHVFDVLWDDDELALHGRVQGHGRTAYWTSVWFTEGRHGIAADFGDCSCPVGENCKHVAALLLTVAGHSNGTLAVADASADPDPWERQLSSLLPPARGQETGRPDHRHGALVPMALQFEVLEQAANPYVRPSAPLAPTVALGVRPVSMGERGNWVRGQLTWDNLRYTYYGSELNPVHRDWLNVFRALHVAGRQYHQMEKWITLDAFNSPLLWQLLAQARQIGVELVTSRKSTVVTLHDTSAVTLDVLESDDGGLRLSPQVTAGDARLEARDVGVIGAPAHGLFWSVGDPGSPLQARDIALAPLAEPLDETLRAFVANRSVVDIPATGRERFLADYYPLLRQRTHVGSSDGSATLPAIEDPVLVLTATHAATKQTPALELRWHWEYPVGGNAVRRPMVDDGSAYRNTVFEEHLLETVTEALAPFPPSCRETFPHAPNLYPGSNEPVRLRDVTAARFSTEALPALARIEHVRIDTSGSAPDYTELSGTPQIGISTRGTDDHDWFDLGVTVTIDGTDIPFDQLFRALAAGEEHLMLPNGHYFPLDQPEFHQLRKLIEEARSLQEPGESLKISRYQAGLWDELAELAATAEQAAAWRSSVEGLLNLAELPATPAPETLRAELRPYQQEGFTWLAFLREHGLGGVLADDMGLGKTLQTLALVSHAKKHDDGMSPFLVVAPTSVVGNWAAEAAKFTPDLAVAMVAETFAKSGLSASALAGAADVVITSYALFRIDYAAYAAQEWSGLILDEAQFVKNHVTKASQNARRFPAPFKLAITGTPLENNLMELWSLFAITAPGLFPSSGNFADYYRKPVEKDGDADRLKQLRRRIRPLIMRRTKEAVAKELPAKQEQVLELDLAPRHRTLYQRHLQRERQKVLGLLGDMDKNRFAIFRSLTTLRMLSLDASLVDVKYASTPSSKLDVLFEQLDDVLAEGHRALIFSQFTSFLSKAAERLAAAGVEYAYLDGKTTRRAAVIERFKSGAAPVFLISLKAGGFGLNLTEADYVFLLDPWWNPATENQAVDRTHRIGQTKNVMVYRLVAKETIEEKVMALKERKAKLFASVMDDDAMFASALTADDVRGLFDA